MGKMKVFSKTVLLKKEAAKEAYGYIKNVLNEEDEQDLMRAAVLKDLFDCGRCVMNVAQVYLKGIILPKEERLFGNDEELDEDELLKAEERIFFPEKRRKPAISVRIREIRQADISEVKKAGKARIIDVRSEEEFSRGHAEGAENIPLERLIINPHLIGNDIYEPVVFVCSKGLKSYKAALTAEGAGYRDIAYAKM